MYQFLSPADFAGKRELIRGELRKLGRNKTELLYVAVNEAVNNAFIHGYGGVARAPVELEILCEKDELMIRIRHQGQGITSFKPLADDEEISWEDHGRGIDIMRCCTDYFAYSEDGRELVMCKTIR